MSGPNMHGPAPNEAKLDANDRLGMQQAAREQPASLSSSEIITTIKTTETTTTTSKQLLEDHTTRPEEPLESVATVEDLGRKASLVSSSTRTKPETDNQNQKQVKLVDLSISLDGSKAVTTIGTIAAQSSETRIVVALLKDGESFQLRVQEMRPRIFEVGSNYKECHRYLEEHEKIMKNLNKQRQAPLECWLNKYQRIQAGEPNMSNEMKLVYMCMAENLQGCWRALLSQLEARLQLLEETCRFYALIERLREALDKADNHVQVFRQEFLDGPGSLRFAQASKEIRRLNELVQDEYFRARNKQHQLVQLIAGLASNNLADSRPNHLIADGQNLINYINSYLAPLERRKIQLESVIKTTTTTTTTTNTTSKTDRQSKQDYTPKKQDSLVYSTNKHLQQTPNGSQQTTTSVLKEISTFNDLNLVENWLNVKIDQLNSSLLSSLGIEAQDSRPILAKHEQIALECSAIEEATLRFKGKNIHAIKQVEGDDLASANNKSLFEQQKVVANKTRDVITILDARIVLLRRTIDFYLRAKDATTDIGKMMRRLQVDNSLQSVQFVSNELELKDVSSVVASGATILSELQQLQLAQKHGQRSSIVNLNLQTNGIRSVIDRLNQDLAHLKTVLNQSKLVLLNEDATKMAQNFSNKCHQLQAWLNNHAKAYLLANSFAGGQLSLTQVSSFLDGHEQLRLAIQNKTLEVEALLRLLTTLTESFDAKSHIADEIQRDTDELRQDWINVTNCVDKRIELTKKYLAILNAASRLDKEMDSIEGSSSSLTSNGRPRTPDERSQDDIRANVDQSLVQLTNQVRNFATDAKRTNTGLVYLQAPTATTVTNDINKDQLVEQANSLLKSLASRKDLLFDANRQPRKLQTNQKAPLVAPPPAAAPQTTITTTKKTTTTTTTATNAKTTHPAGAKTNVVPIFTRGLVDKQVEPFSLVELECELDPASISEPPEASKPGEAAAASRSNCEVEWLMNNYKKIPPNIKHSIVSEGNRHRLIIGQFNPTCCGTYTARATDRLTGQWATSSCRLSLSGIKEDAGEAPGTVQATRLAATTTAMASPDATSTTSSFSQWRPSSSGVGATAAASTDNNNNNNNKTRALERIIKGVDSSEAGSDAEQPAKRTTSKTTTTTTTTKTSDTSNSLMPVTRTIYNPNGNNNQLRINYIDSPTYSSSTNLSRSISRSPFEGSPQPPVFMQSLRKDSSPSAARSASRSSSGLVCVVVGNPPPTIEWLHNNVPIATAKCPRPGQRAAQKGNICKLTIATNNNNRDGQYVCRASNRLGQTSTALTLTK